MNNSRLINETIVKFSPNLCNGCGICCRVCLFHRITMNPDTHLPEPVDSSFKGCSRCGHCEAFCPQSAIRVSYGPGEKKHTLQTASLPGAEQIRNLVQNRRSIRHYREKPIPRNTIETILDIVRYAPTAMNLQEIAWHVISDPETMEEVVRQTINWIRNLITEEYSADTGFRELYSQFVNRYDQGENIITYGAPHLLIVHAAIDNPTAFRDAVIATSYLDLIAPVFHLGTCWSGLIKKAADNSPEVMKSLELPKGHIPHTIMMLGYPRFTPVNIPSRNLAKITWK